MRLKIALILGFLVIISPLFLLFLNRPSLSAFPTNIKDTLSSSQLSYFGRIAAVTAGSSVITIGYSAPSTTTVNLDVGDTIGIGTTGVGVGPTGPLTIYTVKDLGDSATIMINQSIGQSNAFIGAAVISTQSAIHTFSWTPTSNFTGGFWQFLIRASSRVGETQNDGIPDQEGFDLGQDVGGTTTGSGTRLKVADVACPNFATGVGNTLAYSIGTTVYNTNTYQVITCSLGAGNTNTTGIGYTATVGRDLSTGSQLINPSNRDAAQGGHTAGTADTWSFYIRHLDSGSVLWDNETVQGRIAVIDAVRVTATVDPTITFTIDTSSIGTTACGITLTANNANTTANAVPFGSLAIGSTANNLAQRLGVITNGNSYVVTTYENYVMRNIADGITIPDSSCDIGTTCTTVTPNKWDATVSQSGFGYSLQNLNTGASVPFNYNDSGYGFKAKPFGLGANQIQNVMYHNQGIGITGTEYAAVCYRIVANTSQEAGKYDNEIIYTATATF